MAHPGHGTAGAPASAALRSRGLMLDARADDPSGSSHRNSAIEAAGIQLESGNKAESARAAAFTPLSSPFAAARANAAFTVDPETSTPISHAELTSSPGGSLRAHAAAVRQSTTQKQSRPPRRNKPQKQNLKWSRGGGVSSEDTGSDHKSSLSQSSSSSTHNRPRSPQPNRPARQRRAYSSVSPNIQVDRKGPYMATSFGAGSGDSRRGVASPRPKGRGREL